MQNSDIRLIVDLGESVRNAAPIQKDPEAAQLIDQLIGTQPDALYFLVQTVLLQKEALGARQGGPAGAASAAAPQSAPEQRGQWGGLFGSRQAPAASAAEAAPPVGGGSSFLKTAAAGAAGVAGGVLLAQGISGLFAAPHDEGAAHADEELKDSFGAPRAEVLHITANGDRVGGMVLSIDPTGGRNILDLFFIDSERHSRGLGRRAWLAAEQRHPDTRVWETSTPHLETRNIHFYVNVCGFHIVEFFNPRHPDPRETGGEHHGPGGDDELMLRFEKVMS